nr:MAG TPA: hypothetical protein [Caudoviricetes sp.]
MYYITIKGNKKAGCILPRQTTGTQKIKKKGRSYCNRAQGKNNDKIQLHGSSKRRC